MDKSEIIQYVEMSRARSVIIDRTPLEKYLGYVREITIFPESVVHVEFNVYDHDEGGIEFYFKYENDDLLILSLEKYLNKKIEGWENITKTGYYPDIHIPYDIHKSGESLTTDFLNDRLELPSGYLEKEITSRYFNELVQAEIEHQNQKRDF